MLLKKFLLEREWSCLERLFRWSIAFIKELFFSFLINLFENSKLENKFCVFQRYSSKIIILFFLSWSLCPDITGSPPSLWQHLHRHILIYMHRLNLPPTMASNRIVRRAQDLISIGVYINIRYKLIIWKWPFNSNRFCIV